MLAVCIVTPPAVHAAWAAALRNLWVPPGTLFLWAEGGHSIADCRNALAVDAVEAGADQVLFLDADVCLPHDGFLRLLAEMQECGLPVVSGVVWSRTAPMLPLVWSINERVAAEWCGEGRDSFLAVRVGFGAVLISGEFLRQTKRDGPWFRWENPWAGGEGEDFYFCRVIAKNVVRVVPKVQAKHLTVCAAGAGGYVPDFPGVV